MRGRLGVAAIALLLGGATAAAEEPRAAAALVEKAAEQKASGAWADALRTYDAARRAAIDAKDEAVEAAALVGMADASYRAGDYALCGELAGESLALSRRLGLLGLEGDALKLAGNVVFQRGDLPNSRPHSEVLLAIRESLADRTGVAVALNNIGTTYKYTEPLLALEFAERALCVLQELGDEAKSATVLTNLGLGYIDLGDYERAIDYLRRGLALAEKTGNAIQAHGALNGLAVTETYRGDYRAALALYDRALEIDKRTEYKWGEAEIVNNIGLVYQAQKNHAQAISYFSRSLALDRELEDRSLEAECHGNLAVEYAALGRRADALREFRESLDLSRRIEFKSLTAEMLTGRARLEARHDPAGAMRDVEEAVAVARSVTDARTLADALVVEAFLDLAARHADRALDSAREAVDASTRTENPDALWQAHLAAGKALLALHRPTEAAAAFDRSIAAIEAERRRVAGPPSALPVYFADKLEPYQQRVSLLLAGGKTADALAVAERSKSRVLSDVLVSGRVRLDKAMTPKERGEERAIENELVSLNASAAQHAGDAGFLARRDAKRRELEAYQTALTSRHPELAFQRSAAPPLTAGEMAALASEMGALVLDYDVTPTRAELFVIAPGARPRAAVLPLHGTRLTRASSELRRQLASHDLAYDGTARELWRVLLSPAARELARASSVVVIPDGALWDVPFHALRSPAGRFLVEDAAVSYAPSMAVLKETRRLARARAAAPARRALLAVGDPAGTGEPALPEAEAQVRALGELYGSGASEILVGAAATEERVKADAADFGVVHLASHAVLDDENPMYSHVLLAKGRADNGFLEARELMELELKAELLVLSACETARGKAPPGEGISGMLWAALAAGAPTTVASLWRVESASTSRLMVDLHRAWRRDPASRAAKAEALRSAQRGLIASGKWAHPFYWAGFVLAGSPD